MSKVKDKVMKPGNNEQVFELTDYEFAYLKDLNTLLQFHVGKSQIISGFLTYVATTRLGYDKLKEGHALQYEVDLKADDKKLTVREVKTSSLQNA